MSKILMKITIFTWCNDDNRAKKANLRIRQPKVIQPLGQLKDRVHEELGVAGNHGIDGVLPDDVSIKTNQALKQDTTYNNDLHQQTISSYFEGLC